MSIPFPHRRFIIPTLSVLLLVSGCFRSPGPDLGVPTLRDQTEKRALKQAELAFLQADYSNAVLRLNRFLRTHPQSSRSLEARWWLARAYQRTGNLSSAVEHFRFLAGTESPNVYQAGARSRLAQLEKRLGESMASGAVKGILVSLGSSRTPVNVDSVLSASRATKGSMVLLDVPCIVDANRQENGQPFSFEAMRSAVQHMHARGASVYLGVTLRCLGHVAGERELENWKDRTYDPLSGTLRRSSYYSLHFWRYRAFLLDWITQLRDLPLSGLVIRNGVPAGLYEGFSPLAVQVFAREFGVDFDPVRMFKDGRVAAATASNAGIHLPAVFWKWAGWKARERLRIVKNLVRTLRGRLPHFEFGVTLQPQSVLDPICGLVYFAEDWIDVAGGPFDRFLVRIEGSDPAVVRSTAQCSIPGLPSGRGRAAIRSGDGLAPVAEIVRHVGQPEKIWTILPREAVPARTQSGLFPKGIGRIYDYR